MDHSIESITTNQYTANFLAEKKKQYIFVSSHTRGRSQGQVIENFKNVNVEALMQYFLLGGVGCKPEFTCPLKHNFEHIPDV